MNDDKIIKDPIKERMDQLPKEFKIAIENSKWEQTIIDISKKHNFTVGQVGTFQKETLLVLLAISNPQDYSNFLKTRMNISDEITKELVAEANEQIFKKIKELLINSTQKVEDSLKSNEKEILSSSGVEIEGDKVEQYEAPPEENIDRNKVLKGVENPTPSNSSHLVDDKLKQPFSVPPAKKDYSPSSIPLTKNTIGGAINQPAPKAGDPYREPVL